jgi:hypothetical protein
MGGTQYKTEYRETIKKWKVNNKPRKNLGKQSHLQ